MESSHIVANSAIGLSRDIVTVANDVTSFYFITFLNLFLYLDARRYIVETERMCKFTVLEERRFWTETALGDEILEHIRAHFNLTIDQTKIYFAKATIRYETLRKSYWFLLGVDGR